MKNVVEAEITWLTSLPPAARARFLAALSHNLTIGVRVLCNGSGDAEKALERVRLLNEVHHRVSSYLAHYHAGNEDLNWVKGVTEYVLGSVNNEVSQQAEQAWSYAKHTVLGQNAT